MRMLFIGSEDVTSLKLIFDDEVNGCCMRYQKAYHMTKPPARKIIKATKAEINDNCLPGSYVS